MRTMNKYAKTCDYCHEPVSVFESLTEFGKHWHERCYIHKINKEIETYKKKFINKTLTAGDRADLVDKYNLVQNLKSEHTEFKGFGLFEERTVVRKCLTAEPDRQILYQDEHGMQPILDGSGKQILVEDNSPSISIRNAIVRPVVIRTKQTAKPRLIKSADEILQIEGVKS
jgi:hypothetical protein